MPARADTSPRDPQRGPLHTLLREHLETFLAERDEAGAPLPRFVVEELRAYLACGVLSAGCARFECEDCGLVRVTALSCKGRGFCPRCCGRRMTARGRHLAERVFSPGVRVRQWVLSLPFDLRWRAAFDHELARALARIAQTESERRYRRLASDVGLAEPRGGAVTVMQRFGSDLRTNLHLHSLVPDGTYGQDASGQRRFFTAPAPSPGEVEEILARIVRRAHALFAERDGYAPDDDELALAQTLAAASRSHGAHTHAPDDAHQPHLGIVHLPTRRKARIDGFDLDAEVCAKEHERDRLERLCRYVLRPPLALDRLKILGPDLVAIALKRPWADGSTHVSMSVRTFLTRLAALVPRPRAHTTLYFGVLAPHAKHRARVVPSPQSPRARAHDTSWAALMRHSFGIDPLTCRQCRGRMRFVNVVFDRREVERLLVHLRCVSDPLPVHPARAPPEHPETFDFPSTARARTAPTRTPPSPPRPSRQALAVRDLRAPPRRFETPSRLSTPARAAHRPRRCSRSRTSDSSTCLGFTSKAAFESTTPPHL